MISQRGNANYGLECCRSVICLLYLIPLLWVRRLNGLADFSSKTTKTIIDVDKDYLSRIISGHSALACDGQPLRLHCPRHSTISIQSAFYGSGGTLLCGATHPGDTPVRPKNHSCSAFTALQKLLSECQSHRDCQLPVNHLVFGKDPCPGTTKYLHVDYKCKPTEHRKHVVCDGESLALRCKPHKVLNIYAAVYGRGPDQTHTCPSSQQKEQPPFECFNHEAVHTVSRSCYGKQRCLIAVGNHTFKDPCFPGTRKYLTVLYACVPQTLLKEVDPSLLVSPSPPTLDIEEVPPTDLEGPFPKGSRRPDNSGAMMSNSLITYAYIKEHPETAALLFTSSVCVGLLLTLLAVSVRVTCRRRQLRDSTTTAKPPHHPSQDEEEEDDEDDEEEGTGSSLISAADRKSGYDWEEVTYETEAAERAERIERREMVIQEIWMNAYYLNGTSCGLH